MAQQYQPRLRPVIVKLADKGGQHLLDHELRIVLREIGAVAPVLPAPEEEYLDAGLSAGLMRGDHIGVLDAGDVDVLVALHQRESADAVADQRRRLEIERFGRPFHFNRETLLHVMAAALQEAMRLFEQQRVILAADPADARGAAPLDLEQQAGAGAVMKQAVAARAQQKRLLQGDQGAVDRAGGGERSEKRAGLVARAAEFR